MAEFKLSRIRYNWTGAWAAGTNYVVDDVVSYAGKTYVSVTQHTAAADFYTDLYHNNTDVPPVADPRWTLMVDGYRWRGSWDVDTFYAEGDIARFFGITYICLDSHTSSGTVQEFETDKVNWGVYSNTDEWTGAWQPDTYYKLRDLVKVNGNIYACNEEHTSAADTAAGIDIDLDKWDLYSESDKWKQDWAADVRYQLNDVVRFGGIVYRCLVGHTSEALFEDNIENWIEVHVGINYRGAWVPASGFTSTRYKLYDVVKYGGDLWKCMVPHDSGSSFAELNWELFAHGLEFEALWDNTVAYQPGDTVRYGGYLYKSNTLNQASQPPLNPSDWTVVKTGANLAGEWSSVEVYDVGDVVTHGGQLYVAVQNSPTGIGATIEEPASGTSVNTDYWELIIPGDRWTGDWQDDTYYALGDLVHWQYTTYRCINVHTSAGATRPDLDVSHTYWQLLIVGDSANKMTSVGDIKTYSTNPVALHLGSSGTVLKNSSGLPTWSKIQSTADVYYVAPTGIDAAGRGESLNDPWRTIRYACENVTGPATIYVKTGLYQETLPIIIPAFVAVVGDEIRGVVVEPAPTRIPEEDAAYTLLAVQKLKNDIQSLATTNITLAPIGTLVANNLDTIDTIISGIGAPAATFGTNTISGSSAIIDAALVLENAKDDLVAGVIDYILNLHPVFDTVACSRDLGLIIDALVYDSRYPGNYKSKMAAEYYANAASTVRNASSDMFYMRDATGLRNMTLRGLTGTLTEVTETGPEGRRPTGGSYVSFDPGWGPDDERTWVGTRSPYMQNCTTFGTGCVGLRLDGELHNGGNKTMVANDFTQVLSDGIGVWVNKDARTEIVSVFTYYNYIGYLAENGGKIRATNGNNSYGIYGSMSEGVNPTEDPITATVNNRYYDAEISTVFCDASGAIKKLFFSNAGQNYTSATFTVAGGGVGASLVADEYRDGGVSEVRIVDPGDSSTPGGGSYVFTTNSAQTGNGTQIVIAVSDENDSATYVGMRVILTSGTGVGQYGYITEYDDVSKIALVSKESTGTPGWDHLVPGTAIESLLDSTTKYAIEPRVQFTSPGSSVTAGILPSSRDWRAVASGGNKFVAIGYETDNAVGNYAAYSSDGTNWSAATLPASAKWRTVTYGGGKFVALSEGTATAYSTNGTTWTAGTITSATWTSVTYGNGKFVAVANGGTKAAYSTDGVTWSNATLPEGADWSGVTYGQGKFVAVAYSDSSTTATVYSSDGITWTSGSFAGGCSCVAYGNGKFVAFDGAVSGDTAFYSTNGITWTSVTLSSPQNWTSVVYGQGRFLAVANGYTNALTSTDGINWSTISLTVGPNWTAVTHGLPAAGVGKFVAIAGGATGSTVTSVIQAGVTTQARVEVVSGRISAINIWEPGSGYSSAPSMTLTDPNNTSDVTVDIYVNNGVLSSPSISAGGTGYETHTTSATIVGDGFMESHQLGKNLVVSNLSRIPSPGDNLNIDGIDDYTYKVTSVTILEGSSAPYTARIVMIKGLDRPESPEHGTDVFIREQYSQVRITGHDLLDIGLGNFEQTNFPDILHPVGTVKSPENELIERNGGRVFYTSTNDLGDFRVGELFAVEQATGTVTLNADFFALQGLEELRLGGVSVGGTSVVVREFSTDSTFTADSNNVVPTQRAIKAYVTRRVSGGGSDAITGGVTSGVVVIGPNRLTTTSLGEIEVSSDVNFKRGVTGMMLAQAYFTRRPN